MLIKIARSSIFRRSVGWLFEHLNSILPVNRLYETQLLLAFDHPKPVYPIHILIVPKKAITDLMDLAGQPDQYRIDLIEDILRCVRELVAKKNLETDGYRLIINGGSYQDVQEFHLHLVSGENLVKAN
jgi:histidine triad (HIT) family protein